MSFCVGYRSKQRPVSSLRVVTLLMCLWWLAGCATSAKPPFRNPELRFEKAARAVVVGQSTKADVLTALGPAKTIAFETGYEVWVYRSTANRNAQPDPAAVSEMVVLFTPMGIASKVRLR